MKGFGYSANAECGGRGRDDPDVGRRPEDGTSGAPPSAPASAEAGPSFVLRAAAPLYLTQASATAGALVDTAALGHHAVVTLAAFVVAIGVYNPAVAAASGMLRGVMPFVTEHREDPAYLASALRNGVWLALLSGGAAAAAVLLTPVIGHVAAVPATTLDALSLLPALLAASTLLTCVGSAATSVLLGLGLRKPVMRAGLAGTGAAVLLSPALVAGFGPLPRLGLDGTGVAMAASAAINAIVAFAAVRKVAHVSRAVTLRPPRVRELVDVARIGIPLAGTVLIKFGGLGVLAMASARLGVDAAAVHSVSIALDNFLFTAATAVGQAVVPIAAMAAAGADAARIRRCTRSGILVAVGAILVLGLALLASGRSGMAAFTTSPVIADAVAHRMPLILLVVLTDAIQVVVGFSLIGIKRTTASLVAFAVGYGLLSIGAIPVASAYRLTGLWQALALTNLVLIAIQGWTLERHAKRLARRVRPAEPAAARSR